MQDLMRELHEKISLLDLAVSSLKERGRVRAETERAYRMALSKRLLQLRTEKQPVTHLADIVRGEEEVSRLRFERDIAESLYDSAKQAIYSYKLQIQLLNTQIGREYGRPHDVG